MFVRGYQMSDCKEITELFYNTVHTINAKDYTKDGYLDRLFVHSNYQGKGVATAICNQLEQAVDGKITTYASITAKPFFEKRGYKVVKERQVERQGIFLTNYVMIKEQ